MLEVNNEDKAVVRELVAYQDTRPWTSLFEKMEELVHELDWESFKGLQHQALLNEARVQARRKFENAWDQWLTQSDGEKA